MKIEDAISRHSGAIRCLNRRYKIHGEPTFETARAGYQKAGSAYIDKLLQIIGSEYSSDNGTMGPPTEEEWNAQHPVTPAKPKLTLWQILDNILDIAPKAAKSFTDTRNELYKPAWYVVYDQNSRQINYTLIGALIFLILLIVLIFKKA